MAYRRGSPQVQAPREVKVPQPGWRGMLTALSDPGDPTLAGYLVNVHPRLPGRPSPVTLRSGRGVLDNLGNSSTHGTLDVVAALEQRLVKITSSGIWVYSPSLGTWGQEVTAANFATAGIDLTFVGPLTDWCVFTGKLVVNDGINTPWTWSGGSGAASLTRLTAITGSCYGRPTVYYGKLFFITATSGVFDTLIWSEENDATTGYDSGGFNNAWQLTQTGGGALYAIQGTNDGLYVFRRSSITVIRGPVSEDFVTAGTNSGVSESVGCIHYRTVTRVNSDIWFMDPNQRPHVIMGGGAPVNLMPYVGDTMLSGSATASAASDSEPWGVGAVEWLRWDFSTTSAAYASYARGAAIGPTLTHPYNTVQFAVSTNPAGVVNRNGAWLVFHAETRQCLGWQTYPGTLDHFIAWTPAAGSFQTYAVHADDSGYVYAVGYNGQRGVDETGDGSGTATAAAITAHVVGSEVRVADDEEATCTQLDLVTETTAAMTPSVNVLSSRENRVDDFTDTLAGQTASPAELAPSSGTYELERLHLAYGTMRLGRWFRPYVTWSTQSSGRVSGLQSVTLTIAGRVANVRTER